MDITVIIVSHNTREMTLECIDSVIRETSSVQYEIIAFDSGSTDGSVDAIKAKFPNIMLLTSSIDVGFASANNFVAKYAHGRYLLLLNPDTVVLDHAIDRLYEFAIANPTCRIWGGRTLSRNRSLNPSSCWRHANVWSVFCWLVGLSLMTRSKLFNWEGYGGWKRDCVRAVDIVTGCFFLIGRDFWDQLGGFDPIFFMYGEEADMCLRARKLGARPTFTPTATIIHYGGASYPDRVEHIIHIMAGRLTLMRRHWSPVSYWIGRALLYAAPIIRWASYGVIAAILKNPTYWRTAGTWHDVWRNSSQWINGWPDRPRTPNRTSE
jgi:GT2 family glycosyltransferase